MRLQSLDAFRGLACLYVAGFHLLVAHSLYPQPWLRQAVPILEFFFIVSGFVMAMTFADSIKDRTSFIAYLIRRMGRIWPIHLAMLALLVLLWGAQNIIGSGEPLALGSLLAQIFMLQTWIPGFALTWNFPAWTLSAEWAAYLIMGVLCMVASTRRWRTIGAVLIVAIAAPLFYRELVASEAHNVTSVARCLTGFFIGYVLHEVWRAAPLKSRIAAQILEPLLIVGFVALLYLAPDNGWFFVNHAFFALFIYVFASDLGFVAKAVSRPWLLWLGKMSFSFYMVHAVILIYMVVAFGVLQRVTGASLFTAPIPFDGAMVSLIDLGNPLANDLLAIVYMAVVTGAAVLVYKYVEDPSRAASSKLAKAYLAKRAEAAAVAAPKPAEPQPETGEQVAEPQLARRA